MSQAPKNFFITVLKLWMKLNLYELVLSFSLNILSANPRQWPNTSKQVVKEFKRMFDHFVGSALNVLTIKNEKSLGYFLTSC